MHARSKQCFSSFTVVVLLLFSLLNATSVFANGARQSTPHGNSSISSAQPAVAPMMAYHVVDMRHVPAATNRSLGRSFFAMPSGVDPTVYEQAVEAAAHNKNAPFARPVHSLPQIRGNSSNPQTPKPTTSFQGQSEVCCDPPDDALAASSQWVFDGVNTFFAVFDTSGTLQSGWPKAATDFFAIPNPGSCSASGQAFTSDPRAFYDFKDQHFWAAILEVEGIEGSTCPFKSVYWIAVSQTNNPTGAWNVYAFDMTAGTTNWADYVEFGFDQQAIYFSGNMFANTAQGNFQYAEVFGVDKATMEAGKPATSRGFVQLKAKGVPVDTVQPVEAIDTSTPPAGIFLNSFTFNGDPAGHDCLSTACSGLVVWTLTNPGKANTALTGVIVPTSNYIIPPRADQPGCVQCVPAKNPPDTRLAGTPVFHNGLISFALTSGLNNGTQVVPGVFWGQIQPNLNADGSIASATVFQSGYLGYSGDGAATYPAVMTDDAGDLLIVLEFMNSSVSPSAAYVARRVSDPAGIFPDAGLFLQEGQAPTADMRWGDFEATAYGGFGTNRVWFKGEYSSAAGTWSTFIGEAQF